MCTTPARRAPAASDTGVPSTVTVPWRGQSPEMARRVLVLPAPLGPSRATICPGATDSDRPETARTPP